MGRLTEENPIWINDETWEGACEPTCEEMDEVYRKLKVFEDIIDEPEKLKLIDALYLERCEEINELRKMVAHYKEMISNGILRVMPCKVGDKVYHVIYDKCAEPQFYISENVIMDVSEKAVYFADDWWSLADMYDNNVFLDKEKAQEALERMKEVQDVKFDNAINELNKIMVNAINDTLKVAEKYELDKNETVTQMGEKIYHATQMGDFSEYRCE